MFTHLVRPIFGILIGIGIILTSLSLRLGNVAPDDFVSPPQVIDRPWYTLSYEALVAESEQALENNKIGAAREYALRAWEKNITSGKASAQMLTIAAAEEDYAEADQLATLTGKLWPAYTLTRAQLADYWLQRNDFSKVLPEWNALLIRKPGQYRSILFPVLQKLINDPQTFPLLQPFMLQPPSWWPAFFSFLNAKNESIEPLQAIYAIRADSESPIEDAERTAFVGRLIREGEATQAYFTWLSGLDEAALELTGQIYDGGFEGTHFNSEFFWQFSQPKGVKIRTATTSGVSGARALHVTINSDRLNFRHVTQRLHLTPGIYQFTGRYKLNRLKSTKGLRWRIYCLGEKTTQLTESMAFVGRSPWLEFKQDFAVPAQDCTSQLLRLEAASQYAHDHKFKGNLWFDDLKIIKARQTVESTAQ
jgi:hypothetical protein